MQLVWRRLDHGLHRVRVGNREETVEGDGGPAAIMIAGLPPESTLPVTVNDRPAGNARTLAPLAGPERCRVATLSDLHFGDGPTFGVLPTVRTNDAPQERCVLAALDEIRAWGADLLVLKGDVTHGGTPAEWAHAAEVLRSAGLPVVATVGNHDRGRRSVAGTEILAAAGITLAFRGIENVDLPGLRVVVADATTHRHHGSYREVGPHILDAAATAPGAVLLAQHHQIHRGPLPTHWPPGIFGPGSGRFLRMLEAANPRTLVTSGHTHRCRARRVRPVVITEVGSPKDHPGVWAGYTVHDGGIRQVVRRVAAPDVLRWTEDTARALFGIWGRWAPGRLDDRCFTHVWPRPVRDAVT